MAVMTHAPNRTEADYTALTHADQAKFDHLMDLADDTADHGEFTALMLAAAYVTGLDIPYGAEIRKCGCSCYCGTVFNPADPDAHVIEETGGYNLGRVQCPTCADTHRETA
ncbi:hypothetical protein PV382_23820 [Streptomyces scabiei]|uniref:hypothetical protein n=1 Tax=Streptomyces scabiei TaxID=1930 RepID=UPI000765903A|nr:hypothetical protein [Streptomyces scabiei]MDX2999692.1 hypothetical protein [Streptomyces scabiei]MDX3053113.1 hypothetical protein [Streptomyces scabiei]MDX3175281.1 hypothetical protein [Streptomyces scabiei]